MDPSPPNPESLSHGWEVVTGEVSDLVKRSQMRDERAFADLMRRYYAPVLKYVRVRVTRPGDVEDVAMEIFERLFHALPSLSAPRRLIAFLFGIARNVCDVYRDRQRRLRIDEVSWQDLPDPETDAAPPLGLIVPGADETFWRREARRQIVGAIRRLPAPEREPLLLRYREQFSYDQIAQMLDVPRETARYRVRRACRRLATMLRPDIEA
jgi:RNA polymerase sigma-70 factor (ECF subfamily)